MLNICMCGVQDSYPHKPTCPFPYFGKDPERIKEWEHRHDLITQLDRFADDLGKGLFGIAPNGASYKCFRSDSGAWVVKRTIADGKGEGTVETIVGFKGRTFDNEKMAICWAIADGRAELPANRPLSERRQLV